MLVQMQDIALPHRFANGYSLADLDACGRGAWSLNDISADHLQSLWRMDAAKGHVHAVSLPATPAAPCQGDSHAGVHCWAHTACIDMHCLAESSRENVPVLCLQPHV